MLRRFLSLLFARWSLIALLGIGATVAGAGGSGAYASGDAARALAPTRSLEPCRDLAVNRLQGPGAASPYVGQTGLRCVSGCVTAVAADGFYIQSTVPDEDAATSEGIFVYRWSGWTNPRDLRPGDLVEIRDFDVEEYYSATEINGLHESRNGDSYRRLGACELPAAMAVGMSESGSDPAAVYERYEGMRVTMRIDGLVAGPTTRYPSRLPAGEPEVALVLNSPTSSLTAEKLFARDGMTTGITYLSGAAGADLPDVATGDSLAGEVTGVLAYRFDNYTLLLDAGMEGRLVVQRVSREPVEPAPEIARSFGICTFNLENLFDSLDDGDGDVGDWSPTSQVEFDAMVERRAEVIGTFMPGCDVLAVQEVEGKDEVWAALAAALGPQMAYDYHESADPRDITEGILYNRRRVQVLSSGPAQACTPADYGVDYAAVKGPRGHPDPCVAGSYPLFTRPPYRAALVVDGGSDGPPLNLTLVTIHLKSRRDEDQGSGDLRLAQAAHVARSVGEGHGVILGDFNDDLGSPALRQFAGFTNLLDLLPPDTGYTYIYKGRAEAVDHIVMTPDLAAHLLDGRPLHINADFPETRSPADRAGRVSDHDPVAASFAFGPVPWAAASAGAAAGAAAGALGADSAGGPGSAPEMW